MIIIKNALKDVIWERSIFVRKNCDTKNRYANVPAFCAALTLLFIRLEFQYIFVIMSKEDSKEEGP